MRERVVCGRVSEVPPCPVADSACAAAGKVAPRNDSAAKPTIAASDPICDTAACLGEGRLEDPWVLRPFIALGALPPHRKPNQRKPRGCCRTCECSYSAAVAENRNYS